MTVHGVIVNTDGHVVPGAKVAVSARIEYPLPARTVTVTGPRPKETTNQADGTFTLTGCWPGTNQFTVEARGFALANLEVNLTNDAAPLRFVMRPGHILRLRILDAKGLPVTNNCLVLPASLEPSRGLLPAAAGGRGLGRPDAEGRVVWESAPNSEIQLGIQALGLESTNLLVPADGREHLVTLASVRPAAQPLTISGSVCDAASGLPIPRFRLSVNRSQLRTSWMESRNFQGGKFQWVDNMHYAPGISPDKEVSLKIEAEGYAPFLSRMVRTDEGEVQLDITLTPSASTAVTVLLPDGSPAANTDIGLDLRGAQLRLSPGALWHPTPGQYNNVLSTDDTGRFALPADETLARVIAVRAEGYAEAARVALIAEPTLRLQPWGRLEGTFFSDGKPAAGGMLGIANTSSLDSLLLDREGFSCQSEANGHFAFPKLPPGTFRVMNLKLLGNFSLAASLTDVTIRPGETTTVALVTCTVTAHVRWPENLARAPGWKIRAYVDQDNWLRQHNLTETTGGALTIGDLPAGSYTLHVDVIEPGVAGERGNQIMRGNSTPRGLNPAALVIGKRVLQGTSSFTVVADPPSGALDLGEIALQPVP
jgi:hypothetical protein